MPRSGTEKFSWGTQADRKEVKEDMEEAETLGAKKNQTKNHCTKIKHYLGGNQRVSSKKTYLDVLDELSLPAEAVQTETEFCPECKIVST